MENRGDDTDVAQPQLDAFQNPTGFHDGPTIVFLPAHFIVAGFGQAAVYLGDKEVGEFFDPKRPVGIAVDHNRRNGLLCDNGQCCHRCQNGTHHGASCPIVHVVFLPEIRALWPIWF